MKYRPMVQLRFRDEEQMASVTRAAGALALSRNEWVLLAIESRIGGQGGSGEAKRVEPEAKVSGVRGGVREHEGGVGAGEVHGSRHDPQPNGKAVVGSAQQDSGVDEGPVVPDCPDCGMGMVRNHKMKRWDCECGYHGKADR